jgi:hypothetical protein
MTTIRYRVSDPSPSCGHATVRLVVKRPDLSVAWRTSLRNVKTNENLAHRLKCTLPSGRFRYFLSGRDAAGNAGTGVGVDEFGFRVY